MAVNLHEARLDEDLVEDLLSLDAGGSTTVNNGEQNHDEQQEQQEQQPRRQQQHKPGPPKGQGGRPAIHVKYPQLVEDVAAFIRLHGFAAHERRRTEKATSCGVSLEQIRSHVEKENPGLRLSNTTVHRLMLPPNKARSSRRLYKGLIHVRVPSKKNSQTKADHEDHHYTMAQIGYCNELFQLHADEGLRISADDKNEINVGSLAVSRYFQLRRFFPTADSPNHLDRDFPYAGSKISPSGYLVLSTKPSASHRRCRSLSPQRSTERNVNHRRCRSVSPEPKGNGNFIVRDKLGRSHVRYGRTGPLYIINRAIKFHSSSAMGHANDLYQLLSSRTTSQGKRAVLLITDNGHDWSPKSLKTFLYLGRLWKNLNLDILVQTTHAAGHSRFNEIEHAWAPLSMKLTGVTLPITLPGETVPPNQQHLGEDELYQKETRVFDNALHLLNGYWNIMTYDGYSVNSSTVP